MAKYMVKEAGGEHRVLNIFEWNEVDAVNPSDMGYDYCQIMPWDGTPIWEPVPDIVSPAQFRKAIRLMGLHPYFMAFLDSLDDAAREEIEYANEFRRSHPFMEKARTDLGFTVAEADALFRFASTLLL